MPSRSPWPSTVLGSWCLRCEALPGGQGSMAPRGPAHSSVFVESGAAPGCMPGSPPGVMLGQIVFFLGVAAQHLRPPESLQRSLQPGETSQVLPRALLLREGQGA